MDFAAAYIVVTPFIVVVEKGSNVIRKTRGVIRGIWRGFAESLGINHDQAPCSMSALKEPVYTKTKVQSAVSGSGIKGFKTKL